MDTDFTEANRKRRRARAGRKREAGKLLAEGTNLGPWPSRWGEKPGEGEPLRRGPRQSLVSAGEPVGEALGVPVGKTAVAGPASQRRLDFVRGQVGQESEGRREGSFPSATPIDLAL